MNGGCLGNVRDRRQAQDLLDASEIDAEHVVVATLSALSDMGEVKPETVAEAMPRVYGLRLTEIESQWRRVLGG